MNTESGIPVTGLYADEAPSGYIEPPTSTQFHSGVEPEMTLPAAWWNYFVNLFTNTNIKTKEDITAILAELNNALITMGITPDPEASNQLATLFQNDVLPVTFADASMNANPYTTSSLAPKHRGNIAINTTTRTIWIATNTTAAAASWSRLWSPENDGSGSDLDADKVRNTTPGTRGLQYLAAAAVSNMAALLLADLKTVDGSGSGLDSDIVRGTTPGARGLQYLAAAAASNIAALILSDIKTVDGHGSGLDADTVDGIDFVNGAASTFGQPVIPGLSAWIIPKGTYIFSGRNEFKLGIYYSGSWMTGGAPVSGLVISDGVNYRVTNSSGVDLALYYRKLA